MLRTLDSYYNKSFHVYIEPTSLLLNPQGYFDHGMGVPWLRQPRNPGPVQFIKEQLLSNQTDAYGNLYSKLDKAEIIEGNLYNYNYRTNKITYNHDKNQQLIEIRVVQRAQAPCICEL